MIQFRKIFFAIAVVFISISIADAMRCVFKQPSENGILGAVKDRLESCPPLFIDSEKEYCCLDTEFKSYCCDLPHFLVNISLWLIPVLIVLLIISSLVSCICCLCCPCCFVYKRRHGRVYRTDVPQVPTAPSYQPVGQQPFIHPETTNTSKTHHLPPGAYPVYPQFTGTHIKNSSVK